MTSERHERKIILAGGSGFIGQALGRHLHSKGYRLTLLSRNPKRSLKSATFPCEAQAWNPGRSPLPSTALDGAFALVNLSGESIAAPRWTRSKKAKIRSSRIDSTRTLAQALAACRNPPQVWINASAVGFYGDRGDQALDESSSAGKGFLSETVQMWEAAALEAQVPDIRLVLTRFGAVLDASGGMFQILQRAYRMNLGAMPGDGKQWFSWIHLDDLCGGLEFLLEKPDSAGIYNLTAPSPCRFATFHALLIQRLSYFKSLKKIGRVPAAIVRLAMGEASELLLASARAYPRRLSDPQTPQIHLDHLTHKSPGEPGFVYRYPNVAAAVEKLCQELSHDSKGLKIEPGQRPATNRL